jgi:hypothetical protein
MRRFVVALAILALGVLPAAAAESNDQRVANLVANNLKASEVLKGFQVKVEFRDGTARLHGWVRNKKQMDEAVAIANRTPQVENVINSLELREEPAAAAPLEPAAAANKPAAPAAPALRPASAAKPQRLPSPALDTPPPSLNNSGEERPILTKATRLPRPTEPAERREVSRLVSRESPREPTPLPPVGVEQVIDDRPLVPQPQPPRSALTPKPMPQNMQPVRTAQVNRTPTPVQQDSGWGRTAMASNSGPRQASAQQAVPRRPRQQPMPIGYAQPGYAANAQQQLYAQQQLRPAYHQQAAGPAAPVPAYVPGTGGGAAPALYDQPYMPNYAWPSYAAYPNYAALTYPKQYSPTAWPYIGPFYPYPQVPLGWRKVTLEWDDGWWFLDFSDDRRHGGGR